MKIFGWSDGGSGCEFYRLCVPLGELTKQDFDITDSAEINGMFTPLSEIDLSWCGERPDVVIGQRVNRDGPSALWQMMAAGHKGHRPRLVYEIDDDLFNVPAANPAFSHFNQPSIQRNIRMNMAAADAITVSTKELGMRVLQEMGGAVPPDRVHVIPNCLPETAYGELGWANDGQPLTVGWAGSSSHAEDFDEVAEPLARFLRRRPEARFMSMGARFANVVKKIDPRQYVHVGWQTSMELYYQSLDEFDIGIIPLRPSVFNQSKSDLKFLEYAARGIPMVMSNCGPYERHIDRGLFASSAWHWEAHLNAIAVALIETGERAARTELAYHYSETRHIKIYVDQWRTVLYGTS